jgi:hypothetical protein
VVIEKFQYLRKIDAEAFHLFNRGDTVVRPSPALINGIFELTVLRLPEFA